MSGKELFEGMGYVDERFVEEAETRMISMRVVSHWLKVASMAACLCLILFGIYNMNQFLNRGETEGLAGEGAADSASPGEGIESEMQQESVVVSPEDRPTGEVPSVILRIDEMTELGFTGTVAELVDTDIFEVGMELNVIIAEGTRHETADGNPAACEDSKVDMIGSYVMVQFIEYEPETGTIVVNIISQVDTPQKGK